MGKNQDKKILIFYSALITSPAKQCLDVI